MNRIYKILLSVSLVCFNFLSASAHEPDHSYMFLRINEDKVEGRLELSYLDVNRALGSQLFETLTVEQILQIKDPLYQYLAERLAFEHSGEKYEIVFKKLDAFPIDEEDDNVQIFFELQGVEQVPENLKITYAPFMDKSPNHKGMLIIEYHWEAGIIDNHHLIAQIYEKGNTTQVLDLKEVSVLKGFWAMVKLGVWHIWIGLDHILFLIALVLPAVVRRNSDSHQLETLSYPGDTETTWKPVARFKPAALYILKIVTFFTIAHSITLAISSLGIMTLPSRYVESIIAFSIALAALHNITPLFKGKEWAIAFAFGLFHGFGFASVLGEKGLGGDYIVLSLLGFNVGVEIGQVAIIAGVFPILFVLRGFRLYPKLLTYGSGLLILISLHWSIERFFEVNIPLGRWLDSVLGSISTLF